MIMIGQSKKMFMFWPVKTELLSIFIIQSKISLDKQPDVFKPPSFGCNFSPVMNVVCCGDWLWIHGEPGQFKAVTGHE